MRFHVVSLPHTQVTREYDWCAYTTKVRRFCNMMSSLSHDVFLYAGEDAEVSTGVTHVQIVGPAEREAWFGAPQWPTSRVFDSWSAGDQCWREMNASAISEIGTRIAPRDFVCVIGGVCQQAIASAFPHNQVVEWGVGYRGVFAPYRVYESHAWRHFVSGLMDNDSLRYADTVIPNSYDACDLAPSTDSGDYLLYLGRPALRKGQDIIREVAERVNTPVVTAGQGDPWLAGAEHVGVVLRHEKAELLAGARALLAPTTYLEPFGGVTVEAMLSGTPVITTDWGVFTETVQNGVNGYRCTRLQDFIRAVSDVVYLDRGAIADNAQRYLTETVRYEYQTYFRALQDLYDEGWYTGATHPREGQRA